MYRLIEYYRTGSFGQPTGRNLKVPQPFPTVEAARSAADLAYREVCQIPESENVFLAVLDASGRVVYSVPGTPFGV